MPKEYLYSEEHFQDSVNDHYDRMEEMERQQQKDIENQIRNQPMPDRPFFTPDQKLMALSWKQPYAELMLHGKIETRTWNTKYRGWVLICASQKGYNFHQMKTISGYQTKRILGHIDMDYKHGKAIAIGRLVDCRPMEKSDEDKCFVEYYPDLYCHVYEDVQAIVPFDWKGSQGWKEVSEEIKKSIRIRV